MRERHSRGFQTQRCRGLPALPSTALPAPPRRAGGGDAARRLAQVAEGVGSLFADVAWEKEVDGLFARGMQVR